VQHNPVVHDEMTRLARPAPPLTARQIALLFPTGGALWPGMAEDLDRADAFAPWIDRANEALVGEGVADGALRGLLAGEGQIKRVATEAGWEWVGDFPLSMAAQAVVGSCLAEGFVRTQGEPGAVAGESMGECAAYCVAGVLDLEDAVRVAWRWARALQRASDELGLRMAVVDGIPWGQLEPMAARWDAVVVVAEAPTLVVLSVPIAHLGGLQAEVLAAQGNLLVSSNACVAHDPRLGARAHVWLEHEDFLASLPMRAPKRELWTAVGGVRRLTQVEELRANLRATTTTRVAWDELVGMLPSLGIRAAWQLGMPSKAYALERLKAEDDRLASMKMRAVRTLAMAMRPSIPPR